MIDEETTQGLPLTSHQQPSKIIEVSLPNHHFSRDAGFWTLEAELPVEFYVKYSPEILNPKNPDLLRYGTIGKDARRLVIVDDTVTQLYGDKIVSYFAKNNIHAEILSIVSNETTKDLSSLLEILDAMEKFGLMRRNEPLIAIGGGVLLDIAGMAASMYRRGVPYIRVPTTLLGLVDASVGAKVAVNHFGRRNRLGAYYPPIAAYLDRSFLPTLESCEISNGLAEIIKIGVIKDKYLFELIENNAEDLLQSKFQHGQTPVEVINLAIAGMLEELEPNLWEKNLKRLVDFGHSFSPLIEMKALPELSHGQAVIIDILYSCILSNNRGLMSTEEVDRVFRTVKRCGLPTFHPFFSNHSIMAEALADTMKHRNGDQNLPIPTAIGTPTFFNDLTQQEIITACRMFSERAA